MIARTSLPWRAARLGLAGLLLLAVLCLAAGIGETSIPPFTVAKVLANNILGARLDVDALDAGIVWNYRLARALVAIACGASLGVCGVVLQSLLRNPLADPYILGISAGASSGAVAVAILGLGTGALTLSAGAFAGALMAFVVIALVAARAGGGPTGIILAGIAGSQLFNALTSFIITRSASAEQARGIMFWLLGNLSGVRWDDAMLALPVAVIGLGVTLAYARALDAFAFGSVSAASLGIPVRRTYVALILATTFMTATMVSLVGAIGFVGLVIPHVARRLVGVGHNASLPAAALMGAIFLVAADIVSRIIVPGQVLPIGVVTALIGAPAFALILTRRSAVA
ncbi:FecCD family ABC transporter permease [Aureimonas frigidaquae]|uniref:ABC transporter permease protein YvrB n=1 Tax=Aureimonas frigidaquae TaxID=424757 RepID=A0A0P0Z3H4_9HYPH|nr:iron ABC transporter permease [Aureimonas frigidaquae]BAT28650.1 ABC transporter permease protein YvrB [Aureimonas frigidaquae]